MNDREILSRLWEVYRETPFASFVLQRKLNLRHDELSRVLNLLGDMADCAEAKHGYRVHKPASTIYKLIQTQQKSCDSPKGKPLASQKESLTGEFDSGIPSADGKNGKNHAESTDDPFPTVPAELKALRQWVTWREETRDSKQTKIPYQLNGQKAQSNNPDTWTDYQTACKYRDRFSGIGFVFSADDTLCGIDLDNCLDSQGKLKLWAEPIVERLKPVAFGEVSPSGKGIKFWTKAHLPPLAKHKVYLSEPTGEVIEAYDRGRYFTVTGKGKGTIGDGQQVIDWLVKQYLSPSTDTLLRPTPGGYQMGSSHLTNNLNIDEVISKIRASRQAAKFDALMQGNTTAHGSQSEADLALCGVIVFWSQDHAVIDAIFRQSRLMRQKWDTKHYATGETYGEHTIGKALSGERETYTPPRKPYSPTRRRLHLTQKRYGGRR